MTEIKHHINRLFSKIWTQFSFAALILLVQVPTSALFGHANPFADRLLKSELAETTFAESWSSALDYQTNQSQAQNTRFAIFAFPWSETFSFRFETALPTNTSSQSACFNWKLTNTHHQAYPPTDDESENG